MQRSIYANTQWRTETLSLLFIGQWFATDRGPIPDRLWYFGQLPTGFGRRAIWGGHGMYEEE